MRTDPAGMNGRWMMVLATALMACDTPSPGFRGIAPVRISVGKSTFDVRVRENRAEAIRLNPEWAPRMEAVAPRAVAAIEKVSGCRVRKLDGDQALILARLKCGKGAEPLVNFPERITYDCEIDETYVNRGLGQESTEMTCRARRY